MMNKRFKYLSIFGLLFVLAACEEAPTIKKPVFSPYSELVTYEVFVDTYASLRSTNPVLGSSNEADAPSYVSETNVANESSATKTISGDSKEMILSSVSSSLNMEVKGYYDNSKNIFEYYAKRNDVKNNKYYNNESTNESVGYDERSFQLEMKGNTVNIFNMNTKALTPYITENTISYVGSQIVSKSVFVSSTYFPSVMAWDLSTDEMKNRYSFYVDDNVLTISYLFELSFEEKQTIGDVEMVTQRRNQTTSALLQFLFTKDEFSYREYRTSNSKIETFDIQETVIVKEVTETSVTNSVESIIRLNNNLSLSKEKKSQYHEGGDILSSLYFQTY